MKRLLGSVRAGLALALAVLLVTAVGSLPATANPAGTGLVVSQVYGGGGNSGATLTNDFVEIFNPTGSPISIAGWSVQYASASGTTWQVTALSGTVAPGQYYLVQEAAGAGGTTPLPTPDATGSIAMSATSGKIALVSSTVALSGSCPSAEDVVGYGTANCFEGAAAAPGLSNTTAALRADNGCTDTDVNSSDFSAGTPAPRNTASPVNLCATGGGPAVVINEIDYDQPGTDASEYIEVKNVGTTIVSLGDLNLTLVNGSGNVVYATIPLPAATLPPDDYFVVCANAAMTANCDLDVLPDTNLIQNGAPDAVALTTGATIIDTVSYEGDVPGYVEGSGTGLVDDAVNALESISRCPDGSDTNSNNVDFQLRPATPGSANDCPGESAPSVTGTLPTDGATDVAVDANLSVTFSEPVDVTGSWFSIVCTSSGAHTASVSGGPTAWTLDPTTDFAAGESCTVTILAALVTDQDTSDPPDNMAGDYVWSVTTVGGPACEAPFTPIYSIQGSGSSAAITGTVTTQGVVVGDFEGPTSAGLQGFYLQDETGDGDPATSDGIFVFTGNTDNGVSAGDVVRVTGFARERFGQTALNGSDSNFAAVTDIVSCGDTASVVPATVTMPFATIDYPERYEGMLVQLPQSLVISEYFNYDRFGELVLALPLSGETRPFTPTAVEEPGADAQARALANSLARITLDDGLGSQNPPVLRHPNGAPFSLSNIFRGGDTVSNTVGVLGFDFSLYRIQPTQPATYTSVNPRPTAPEPVGGSIRVASMNTLNYFLTLDDGTPKCGPALNQDCRGADANQPDELTRQRTKLLAALAGLDSDVIGLNEIENTTGVEPLADIVAGLPGYGYIDTGTIGTDAIKVGLIYRFDKVTPVGDYAILDSSVDPRFIDTKNRPVLAQTFEDLATGSRFTVAVNHLKSKGSSCDDVGDPDTGDGQGNCNSTRTAAAEALVDWLATDPTGSGDADVLIVGDLNSYAMEDPIAAIVAGADDTEGTADDYANLVKDYLGTYAYSYVFDGQFGYLDHTLANAHLAAQVTGVTEWHINADESDVLDYDTSFKPPEQEALYEPNAFRSSDHDPVIVGLDLQPTFDDLCRLTRRLVTSEDVADGLCDKLEAAKDSAARGNTTAKENQLQAYRNQLDGQTGKAVSADDAAQLKALSMTL